MQNNILRKKPDIKVRTEKYYLYDLQNLSADDKFDIENYFKCKYDANKDNHRYMLVNVDNDEERFIIQFFDTPEELYAKYTSFKMFDRDDRSSFKYWFAHWCGFQITALNLGIWKFKYLFHDIEKPWLKLMWKDYDHVQKWHREHNSHHLEYGLKHGFDKIDWVALMIDWECSALSKRQSQMDAREAMDYELEKDKWKPYAEVIRSYYNPVIERYNL